MQVIIVTRPEKGWDYVVAVYAYTAENLIKTKKLCVKYGAVFSILTVEEFV